MTLPIRCVSTMICFARTIARRSSTCLDRGRHFFDMTSRVTATTPARRREPMISSAAAAGLLESVKAAGRDPDEILRAVGLDRARLTDRQAFVPSAAFTLALDEAARLTG